MHAALVRLYRHDPRISSPSLLSSLAVLYLEVTPVSRAKPGHLTQFQSLLVFTHTLTQNTTAVLVVTIFVYNIP
jgi:hypothetical protein